MQDFILDQERYNELLNSEIGLCLYGHVLSIWEIKRDITHPGVDGEMDLRSIDYVLQDETYGGQYQGTVELWGDEEQLQTPATFTAIRYTKTWTY